MRINVCTLNVLQERFHVIRKLRVVLRVFPPHGARIQNLRAYGETRRDSFLRARSSWRDVPVIFISFVGRLLRFLTQKSYRLEDVVHDSLTVDEQLVERDRHEVL